MNPLLGAAAVADDLALQQARSRRDDTEFSVLAGKLEFAHLTLSRCQESAAPQYLLDSCVHWIQELDERIAKFKGYPRR